MRCGIKHLQIRLEDSEHEAFKNRAREIFGGDERVLQKAGREVILAWTHPAATDILSDLTSKQRQLVEQFIELLKHGGLMYKNSVLSSLQLFTEEQMVKRHIQQAASSVRRKHGS